MKVKEFFGKFASGYLWGNLLAMMAVVAVLFVGLWYGLEVYTRHDKGIEVPNLVNMYYSKALLLVENEQLAITVTDSAYNKRLPANCILAQTPGPGMKVKPGHVIYVTVNSLSSPSFIIPDVVDNCSYREAEARLIAIGFKMLPPKKVLGEKDWVYGIMSRGRRVNAGDRVNIDSPLTLSARLTMPSWAPSCPIRRTSIIRVRTIKLFLSKALKRSTMQRMVPVSSWGDLSEVVGVLIPWANICSEHSLRTPAQPPGIS